jgi:hypothetical protein
MLAKLTHKSVRHSLLVLLLIHKLSSQHAQTSTHNYTLKYDCYSTLNIIKLRNYLANKKFWNTNLSASCSHLTAICMPMMSGVVA